MYKLSSTSLNINKKSLLSLTTLSLAVFSSLSLATDQPLNSLPTQDTSKLDTLTVVGTRTETSIKDSPVSVSVLDRDEISKRGADSVAELLRTVPGISVVDSAVAGMKRVRIRGEQSNRVVIFVDGQELTDHSSFGSPFLVDPSSIERIEVVRGPASVLHGAKAIGGVINVVTRKGAPKPIQLEVGGAYHSGTRGGQAMAAISGTLDEFDYRLSVSGDDHGDRKVAKGEHSPDRSKLDNSSFRNKDVTLHLGQKFGADSNHYVSVKANHHKLKADGWEDNFSLVEGLPATGIVDGVNSGQIDVTKFNADMPKRELNKVGLYYTGDFEDNWLRKVSADAFYQQVDREFENALRLEGDNVAYSQFPPSYIALNMASTSEDTTKTYGGSLQLDLDFHQDHYTIFGVQYLEDKLKTDKSNLVHILNITPPSYFPMQPPAHLFPMEVGNSLANDEASMQTFSAFVQDEWRFADDFLLTLGGRYYWVESELEKTTSSNHQAGEKSRNHRFVKAAGLTYSGLAHSTLRASYAEGYVMPTLLEQFTDSRAGRGITLHGNPNLKPETSRNYELGLRYKNHGVVFDGALFYSQAKNYITFESCEVSGLCSGGDRYINADKAKSYGLEVLMEYWIADTPYTPYITSTLMKRKLEVAEFSTSKTDLPLVAAQTGVRYENLVRNVDLWGDLYLQGQTSVDKKERAIEKSGKQSRHLAGWTTLNLALGANLGAEGQHRISLNLNNLLNKHYRAAVDEMPAMGRNAVISFSSQF